MKNALKIIVSVQGAKHSQQLKFTHHPLRQAIERGILPSHIMQALNSAKVEIIRRQNPPDPRNPSPACTFLGLDDDGRPLHVVVAHHRMLVVTSYEPTPPKWVTPRERGTTR